MRDHWNYVSCKSYEMKALVDCKQPQWLLFRVRQRPRRGVSGFAPFNNNFDVKWYAILWPEAYRY